MSDQKKIRFNVDLGKKKMKLQEDWDLGKDAKILYKKALRKRYGIEHFPGKVPL